MGEAKATTLLSVEDLCARWGGCDPRVVYHEVDREGLPFVPLGPAEVRRLKRGRKRYLFRLEDVLAHEASRRRVWGDASPLPSPDAPPPPPELPPVPVIPGWDGKIRGKRGRGAKA